MKLFSRLVLISTALLILSACQSTKVKVDYDSKTNFQDFKSFSFVANKEITDKKNTDKGVTNVIKTNVDNPILMGRIKSAIKEQLMAQGFTYQAKDSDLTINYHFIQQEKENNSSFSIGIGGSSYGGSRSSGVSVGTTIPINSDADIETTIIIDFSANNKAIWHGQDSYIAESDFTSAQRSEKVTTTITKLLAEFPPK
jgi:hypothetical protein